MAAVEKRLEMAWVLDNDLTDNVTHGICVSNLAFSMGRELGLSHEKCHELAVAGILHDIGKMKLSRYLHGRNEDTLGIEEMKYIRMHSQLSYDILKKHDYSEFILESILYHHENYDGTGYPNNLLGEKIPFGARIMRICDVFSALTSDRAYRQAFDKDTAVELMIDEVKNFDMRIFLTFLKVVNDENFNIERCYKPTVTRIENIRIDQPGYSLMVSESTGYVPV
ncbi:HD-GYP domain-containing protein [Anaerobium acetethylicum]|uniref:HDIG domain-containing protein n=1 Tax=Anaerobium acetethylicum TaxID=1619234 RepID=A0A1D3TT97_9FIRM|nr:HD domain-containing phosphohydrolase [Anaerobium acetethylicum]SCP97136.1 HDIG domain-containing protein [Anaerobium acetethylicum]